MYDYILDVGAAARKNMSFFKTPAIVFLKTFAI